MKNKIPLNGKFRVRGWVGLNLVQQINILSVTAKEITKILKKKKIFEETTITVVS